MAVEVLRHGVVVANKNITADGLVPGQGLSRRQRLEPLIHRRLTLAVNILVTLLIPPILLPNLTAVLLVVLPPVHLPIHHDIISETLTLIVTVKIQRRRRVDALIKPAVQPGITQPVPGVIHATTTTIGAVIVNRSLPRIVAEAVVGIRLEIASKCGVGGVAEVEVAALLGGPLGRVVGAPDGVVEREIS